LATPLLSIQVFVDPGAGVYWEDGVNLVFPFSSYQKEDTDLGWFSTSSSGAELPWLDDVFLCSLFDFSPEGSHYPNPQGAYYGKLFMPLGSFAVGICVSEESGKE
jgi:hypothetical protein